MTIFATRKALGRARQEAALNRVRVQELEEALGDLLKAVDALPLSVSVQDHPDLRAAVAHRRGVSVRYHALTNPLFSGTVEAARTVLRRV